MKNTDLAWKSLILAQFSEEPRRDERHTLFHPENRVGPIINYPQS